MNRPQVTVVVPVRNGEQWIEEAIDSVLTQSFPNFELLVVDDGSSDRTPAILKKAASADARIKIIRQGELGLVAALNQGIRLASGDLIARLDADDRADRRRLSSQVDFFESREKLVLLGTWAYEIDEQGGPLGTLSPETDPSKLHAQLLSGNPFIHSSVMFRAAAVRACGGYRAALKSAEDFDLWLRLSERGTVAILPDLLTTYRVHVGSVSANDAVRQLFSTRLAILSAKMRRTGKIDFVESLSEVPEWETVQRSSVMFNAASVSRLLQYADRELDVAALSDETIRTALASDLNHRERKFAQVALLNALRRGHRSWSGQIKLASSIFCLHPLRAIKMLATGSQKRAMLETG